jgi:hypothetical protein
MDDHLYDFGPKALIATFTNTKNGELGGFTGKYYENSILEIFDGDELIDTLYSIEEYRAEYVFNYHYGNEETDAPDVYTGSVSVIKPDD